MKELLLSGRNVLMLAPRRIGKTWLMKQVAEDLRRDGHVCIHINVEGMRTEAEFLRTLCHEIDKERDITGMVTSLLKTKLNQIKAGNAGDTLAQMIGTVDHRLFLENLVAALDQRGTRTLVMIDEFSLFILEQARQDPDATRALLYHLRRLQQGFSNVSWLLTGSIGLDAVARRLNLEGALLEFVNFPLAPFTRDEAASYLAEQTAQRSVPFDVEPAAFDRLVHELGWLSPYYLGHIAHRLRPTASASDRRAVATEADVVKAFEDLLTPTYRSYFSPWKEHIDKNFLPTETELLAAILAKCCRHADGETEETLLVSCASQSATVTPRFLKDMLIALFNDGYLMKDEGRWRFRSVLLRHYWLEYIA